MTKLALLAALVLCLTTVAVGRRPSNTVLQSVAQHHSSLKIEHLEEVRRTVKNIHRLAHRQFYGQPLDKIRKPNKTAPSIAKKQQSSSRRRTFDDVQASSASSVLSEYLFEGDLLLTPKQANTILQNALAVQSNSAISRAKAKRRKRASMINHLYNDRWTVFPIPYKFGTSLSQGDIADITAGINYYQRHTCLTFRYEPNPLGIDYLEFYKGGGCFSGVGREGGQQGISIGDGCTDLGVVTHEMAHALGLWHEQSRPDFASYVQILSQNVATGFLGNFLPRQWGEVDLYGVPYDYGSVMHYGTQAFTIDWNVNTLVAQLPGYNTVVGQHAEPSFYDLKIINIAYCNSNCQTASTYCLYGGYPHPLDCSRCVCPSGIGGQNCERAADPVNANCGGVIGAYSDWTNISSPGYPNIPYNPNVQCSWIIRSRAGTRIVLEFIDKFTLDCQTSCLDYVEVKNGSDFGLTGMRYCCYETPTIQTVSETNEMVVIFSSQQEFVDWHTGFRARIRQEPLDPTEPVLPTDEGTDSNDVTDQESLLTTTTDLKTTSQVTISEVTTSITTSSGTTPTPETTKTTTTTTTMISTSTRVRNLYEVLARGNEASGDWGSWSEWSSCSQSCGACGLQSRRRNCNSDNPCWGEAVQFHRCGFDRCPLDAKDSSGDFCQRTTNFDFPCTKQGKDNGAVCSSYQNITFPCDQSYCCQPFVVVDGKCSFSGNAGALRDTPLDQTNHVTDVGSSDWSKPEHVTQIGWSDWSVWGECEGPSCGGCATQRRSRTCIGDPSYCVGYSLDLRRCNLVACPSCGTNLIGKSLRSNVVPFLNNCECCLPLRKNDISGVCE